MTKLQSLLTELKRLEREAIALNSPPPVDYRDFHSAFRAERNYNAALRNASPVLIEALEIAVATMEYAVGPTRDVKTPKILEALAKLDALCERGK